MPTRPTKGDHGHSDSGSKERGGQKATYGSSVSAEVADGQREAIEHDQGPRVGDTRPADDANAANG